MCTDLLFPFRVLQLQWAYPFSRSEVKMSAACFLLFLIWSFITVCSVFKWIFQLLRTADHSEDLHGQVHAQSEASQRSWEKEQEGGQVHGHIPWSSYHGRGRQGSCPAILWTCAAAGTTEMRSKHINLCCNRYYWNEIQTHKHVLQQVLLKWDPDT